MEKTTVAGSQPLDRLGASRHLGFRNADFGMWNRECQAIEHGLWVIGHRVELIAVLTVNSER